MKKTKLRFLTIYLEYLISYFMWWLYQPGQVPMWHDFSLWVFQLLAGTPNETS